MRAEHDWRSLSKVPERSLRGLSQDGVTSRREAWALESGNSHSLSPVPSSLGSWCHGALLLCPSGRVSTSGSTTPTRMPRRPEPARRPPARTPSPTQVRGQAGRIAETPAGTGPLLCPRSSEVLPAPGQAVLVPPALRYVLPAPVTQCPHTRLYFLTALEVRRPQ